MGRGTVTVNLVHLTQQVSSEFWEHSSDPRWLELLDAAEQAAVIGDDDARVAALEAAAHAMGDYLVAKLGPELIEQAHAILHDSDTCQAWDAATGQYVQASKALHIHFVVKAGDRGLPMKVWASGFGVEPQYVAKGRRGGRPVEVDGVHLSQSHDDQFAYLTHVKYVDKFQYRPEQVASVVGLDYRRVYEQRRPEWFKGRAYIANQAAELEKEPLLAEVRSGHLFRQQILLTDAMYEVYSRHQREFDDAFAAFGQRRAMIAADKLERGEFSTTIIYSHGAAGAGKTEFAKQFMAAAMQHAKAAGATWSVYRGATMNPLDDWAGEEIIFLDDLRPGAMTANDWLLLLDPVNASPARARYRNKAAVAPRLIVITATVHPVDFFFAREKGGVDEPLDQFLRRLTSRVRVFYSPGSPDGRGYEIAHGQRMPEPYVHQVHLTPRSSADPSSQAVTLTRGFTDPLNVSRSAAIAAAVHEVGQRCRDLGAWPPLRDDAAWELHDAELQANPALQGVVLEGDEFAA
jgi:hypothetical protein